MRDEEKGSVNGLDLFASARGARERRRRRSSKLNQTTLLNQLQAAPRPTPLTAQTPPARVCFARRVRIDCHVGRRDGGSSCPAATTQTTTQQAPAPVQATHQAASQVTRTRTACALGSSGSCCCKRGSCRRPQSRGHHRSGHQLRTPRRPARRHDQRQAQLYPCTRSQQPAQRSKIRGGGKCLVSILLAPPPLREPQSTQAALADYPSQNTDVPVC